MSRKPLPILQDMPIFIKRKIAENVELYTDKMALRGFSSEFQRIIGDPQAQMDNLHLSSDLYEIELRIAEDVNSLHFIYRRSEHGCLIKSSPEDPGRLLKDQDYAQVALEDFKAFTDNPNLTLGSFDLTVLTPNISRILPKLIPGKLKVHTFRVVYSGLQEEVLPVLTHLDSEVLKVFNLSVSENATVPAEKKEFEQMVKLDQWKKLWQLQLCKVLTQIIPVEHRCNMTSVRIDLQSDLSQIRALITNFYRSATFKRSFIKTSLEASQIRKAIGELLPWEEVEPNVLCLTYPEPATIVQGQSSRPSPYLQIYTHNHYGNIFVLKCTR